VKPPEDRSQSDPDRTPPGLWWAQDGAPSDVEATHRSYDAYQDDSSRDAGPGWDHRGREGALRGFVRRYGWRAYALPLLAVVTVVALTTAGQHERPVSAAPRQSQSISGPLMRPGSSSAKAPPTAVGDQALKTDDPGADSLNTVLQSDALPTGGPYTLRGKGTYSVIPGTSPVVGHGTLHKYTIEVENGVTGIDLGSFAATVQTVLSDPRSWTAGNLALQRVDSGPVDFHVTITSSITVRTLCGYEIPIETSCFAPAGQNGSSVNRVVLNDARWVRGDAAYIGDLDEYRLYMINHETGHALGHEHAHNCLSDGLAPAMMQQTIGLKATNGQMCQANPWPYPPGAKDAPGAEAPDTQINNEFNLQNE
jgi:hypothetical protein